MLSLDGGSEESVRCSLLLSVAVNRITVKHYNKMDVTGFDDHFKLNKLKLKNTIRITCFSTTVSSELFC